MTTLFAHKSQERSDLTGDVPNPPKSQFKSKKEFLPKGVRVLIYSFLDFKTLGTKVCCLSQKEKNALLYTEVLNQLLPLDIPFATELFENRQYFEIVV